MHPRVLLPKQTVQNGTSILLNANNITPPASRGFETMTKVCYISPISIHSIRYLEEFHRRGYNTSIIADSQTWIAPRPTSIPVYTLPQLTRSNFSKQYIPNLLDTMRTLKEINPDFVHIHAQDYYSPAVILSRKPFLLTSWGTEVLRLPRENPFIRYLAKITAVKASRITVDAEILKEIWIAQGIPNSKVEVIPFGVDLQTFNPKADGSKVRQDLKILKDDTVLISTRALHNSHYNVESFIRAIPLILKSHHNVKFIVKGKGPLEGYLRILVNKLGVSEHVRFVGIVPHSQMANYLAAADIYVSTCFVDTTSVSLLEAMACGLAPLVTDIPGNREWIENGVNGLLFQPKNPEELAKKAIQLVENSNERKRFGELCIQTIRHRAAWKDCVARMERIYQSFPQRS
jgi:glycosyltransferase involved in cell wall biosynthesis